MIFSCKTLLRQYSKSKCVRICNKIRREIELVDFLNFTHLSGLKLIIVGTKIFQFCKWLCSIIILVHCCFWKGRCRRYAKNYTFNQCFFTEILWSHFVLLYLIVIFLPFCEIFNNIVLNFGGIQRTDIVHTLLAYQQNICCNYLLS